MTFPGILRKKWTVAVLMVLIGPGVGVAYWHFRDTAQPVPIDPLPSEVKAKAERVIARYRGTMPAASTSAVRVLHALRNFPGAAELKPDKQAQHTYLEIVCDDELYPKHVSQSPVLVDFGGLPGFRPWAGGDDGGEGHFGQFLMFLGEIEAPLSTPVRTAEVDHWTLADYLKYCKRNAHGDQDLCWLLPALNHYVSWDEEWENKFGQVVTLEKLAQAHIDHDEQEDHCTGTHHFYAVAVLADRLRREGRAIPGFVRRYLKARIALAQESQLTEGTWSSDWFLGSRSKARREGSLIPSKMERLRYTGHLLECLALCVRVERVNRQVLEKATDWICNEADGLVDDPAYHGNTVLSHAVHALILSSLVSAT